MDELMRSNAELEDVVELMQRIQLHMSVKEAARTSVLSKSWLHAWSTIPILRLSIGRKQPLKLVDVDRTIARYLRDNIPIQKFHLVIDLENQESASHAENWIRDVGAKTCVKDFSLGVRLYGASITLPDEILSGENLTKIKVTTTTTSATHSILMTTNPVIKCVSLRELHLDKVRISEKVLDEILSSCRLLVKIVLLRSCEDFEAIKVKNLPCLRELIMDLYKNESTVLEVNHVPNLCVFSWNLKRALERLRRPRCPFNAHSISLGSNVKQLTLGGVITDKASLDNITSGLPFLKSLTLHLTPFWTLGIFSFTCASINSLSLLGCPDMLTDVQVSAPKLRFFSFRGYTMPNLSFPVSTLKIMELSLRLRYPIDASFFIKMRETLMLSRTCFLVINTLNNQPPLDIDIDDLRTRLPYPPAMNVQQLSFQTERDECLWERSAFFDAFFEICHPKLVYATPDAFSPLKHNNHFCRLMLREVLEKKTTPYWLRYLKRVQVKPFRHRDREWEALTDSHTSLLDGSTPSGRVDFKLNWR